MSACSIHGYYAGAECPKCAAIRTKAGYDELSGKRPIGHCPTHGGYYAHFRGTYEGCPICAREKYGDPSPSQSGGRSKVSSGGDVSPAIMLLVPPLLAGTGLYLHYHQLQGHFSFLGFMMHGCIAPAAVTIGGAAARLVDGSSLGDAAEMLIGGVMAAIVTIVAMFVGGLFGGDTGMHVTIVLVFLVHWGLTSSTWEEWAAL